MTVHATALACLIALAMPPGTVHALSRDSQVERPEGIEREWRAARGPMATETRDRTSILLARRALSGPRMPAGVF